MTTIQFIGLVGRTGAGKDLIASRLAADLPNCIVLPIGQRIRDSADPAHPYHKICRELRDICDRGELPSAAVVWPLIERMLDEAIKAGYRTLIGTGDPRVSGIVDLHEQYARRRVEYGLMITQRYVYLFAPEEVTRGRIQGRRLDDLSAGRPIRIDDAEDRQLIRTAEFEDKTWTAVREAASVGKLIVVDARKSPDEVHQQVLRELDREVSRPLAEVFQELRGWTDQEAHIPCIPSESIERTIGRR